MLLVDVHAHLDDVLFGSDISGVLERASKAGVKAVIANGVDKNTNRQVLALAVKYPVVKAALGIYPMDKLESETKKKANFTADDEILFIEENIKKITAIGECGLDYSDVTEENKIEQIRVFEELIAIAKKYDRPIIVHSRKAEKDTIEILEKSRHNKVVMHCFSGNHKLVERIRINKWFFSIPTNIVRNEHFQKVVNETPLSQLLTETDAPFLSPFKEQINEPAFVYETIKKIAWIKRMDETEVANNIYSNYQRIFL
ncbi:MAG: TatD family hydrolase [archaeon]